MNLLHTVRAASGLLLEAMPAVSAWRHLVQDESGQDTMEYALVAAIISLCAIAGIRSIGTWIAGAFTTISTSVSSTI